MNSQVQFTFTYTANAKLYFTLSGIGLCPQSSSIDSLSFRGKSEKISNRFVNSKQVLLYDSKVKSSPISRSDDLETKRNKDLSI